MDLRHIRFQGVPSRPRSIPVSVPKCEAGLRPSRCTAAADEPIASGLAAYVLERTGLDPTLYRHRPLERRISACLRALKVESEAQARVRIDTGVAARGVALDALLIGVSSFFRDPAVFDTIRTHVIPALRARLRPPRVWSVGCSSGAELYSVGILLASAGLLDGAELLGTDCRPDAVARARSGLFDHDAMSDLDGEVRQRFFERTQGGWRIDRSLRDRVTWSVADATTTLARGAWDLVLCRNVVIYLRAVAGDALVQRIAGALAPGGFLVVGKAERPRVPGLTLVNRCTYRNDVAE